MTCLVFPEGWAEMYKGHHFRFCATTENFLKPIIQYPVTNLIPESKSYKFRQLCLLPIRLAKILHRHRYTYETGIRFKTMNHAITLSIQKQITAPNVTNKKQP